MKKLLTIMLAMLMIMSLVGCSKKEQPVEIKKEIYEVAVSEDEDVVYINIDDVNGKDVKLNFGENATVTGNVNYSNAGTYTITVNSGSSEKQVEVVVGNSETINKVKEEKAKENKQEENNASTGNVPAEDFDAMLDTIKNASSQAEMIEAIVALYGEGSYDTQNFRDGSVGVNWRLLNCEEANKIIQLRKTGIKISIGYIGNPNSDEAIAYDMFLNSCK